MEINSKRYDFQEYWSLPFPKKKDQLLIKITYNSTLFTLQGALRWSHTWRALGKFFKLRWLVQNLTLFDFFQVTLPQHQLIPDKKITPPPQSIQQDFPSSIMLTSNLINCSVAWQKFLEPFVTLKMVVNIFKNHFVSLFCSHC